jgi:hypothetical protein
MTGPAPDERRPTRLKSGAEPIAPNPTPSRTRKSDMTDARPNLKARALHEFARFATMFAYLWAMFLLFQIHQYVVLAQHQIPFTQYGVGLVNALVLAKVMLVADDLRLGEWRGRRPLVYPVLMRSVLFAIVFIVFDECFSGVS